MALEGEILRRLASVVGKDGLLTAAEDLLCYSYDATPVRHLPEAVVLPRSAAEVASVLSIANDALTPVVPRGSGTNLSGGSVPVAGGIVLATSRMNRILEIDADNLTATAQPGVILAQFHQAVEERGLFYPPDPASLKVATLGGTVAQGAGGPRGLKYGTTKDYVIALEVALAEGSLIRTGAKTVKNVSGYDLTHLLVGSQGTLGVITEITVRLLPLPQAKKTCLAIFDTIDAAAQAVASIIGRRIIPTTLELIDDVTMQCIEGYQKTGLPQDAEAVLLMEVDGSPQDVPRQFEEMVAAARDCGAREVRVAASEEEREALWTARRAAFAAVSRARPSIVIEDATVPRPALPQMVRAIKEAAQRYNLLVGLMAHAGDGNTHPQIMCDASDKEEMARVERFTEEIFRMALSLGGTLTGEHGIGLLKSRFLPWQFGEEGVAVMRRIKKALDPQGILNPGKMFPNASS
ncbi:MAG: FAD-binding protein [Chloroflexi bacterium]|nr:FAD-binding protein [Chloroflexota bacterium]